MAFRRPLFICACISILRRLVWYFSILEEDRKALNRENSTVCCRWRNRRGNEICHLLELALFLQATMEIQLFLPKLFRLDWIKLPPPPLLAGIPFEYSFNIIYIIRSTPRNKHRITSTQRKWSSAAFYHLYDSNPLSPALRRYTFRALWKSWTYLKLPHLRIHPICSSNLLPANYRDRERSTEDKAPHLLQHEGVS